MQLGDNQVFKLSGAESSYGETIVNPTWGVVGIAESGDIGSTTSEKKIYGIGSQAFQARYAGKVENEVRVEIACPSAAILNPALVRTAGVLASYNCAVGAGTGAWRGVGLKWNTLALELDSENYLKATLEGIFKSLLATTVATEGHDPGDVVIWQPDGLVLSVAGAPDTELQSFKINVNNNLQRKYVANSTNVPKRTLKYLREGAQDIEVSLQTLSEPSFDLEADCPGHAVTLSAVFTDLCGGATPDTLTIALTGGAYKGKKQPLKPNSEVDYSIDMTFDTITIS